MLLPAKEHSLAKACGKGESVVPYLVSNIHAKPKNRLKTQNPANFTVSKQNNYQLLLH